MLIEIEPEMLSEIVYGVWELYSNGLASVKMLEWATNIIFDNEWNAMYNMPEIWFPELYSLDLIFDEIL